MLTFLRENSRWLGTGFFLTVMASFGQTWFISLFAGEIRAAHGISDGTWGGIYTVATLASAALLFWRGSLADTIPLGKLAPIICLCFAVSSATLALAPNVFILALALFGLRFCGQGMFGHISMTAMGRWFREFRGRAVAIAGFGHAAGEMIWPLPAILVAGLIGWKATWLGIAAFLAIVFAPVLVMLLSKDRMPQGSGGSDGNSGAGLRGRHWARSDVIRHWLFPALLPILLAPGFIGTVVFFHQVHIAEMKGWTLSQMAPGYMVFASVTTVCGLISGWVADRFGPVNLLPMLLVPMGLGVTVVLPASGVSGWFLALGLIGMTQGMAGALWGTFLPQVYGTKHLGAVRALGTTVMVVSSAIGPGITGLLINLGYSFPVQAPGMGLWCLLATGLGFWIRARLKPELVNSVQPT